MVSATGLASVGLVLNMIGVGFAFFFGYPQPSHDEGVSLGLEPGTPLKDGRTVAEFKEDVGRRKAKYLLRSKVGLVLMFAGFALQFAALFR